MRMSGGLRSSTRSAQQRIEFQGRQLLLRVLLDQRAHVDAQRRGYAPRFANSSVAASHACGGYVSVLSRRSCEIAVSRAGYAEQMSWNVKCAGSCQQLSVRCCIASNS